MALLYRFSNNTVYSNGFTNSKFAASKIGMTESEVSHLLGPPCSRMVDSGHEVFFEYTRRGARGFYRLYR